MHTRIVLTVDVHLGWGFCEIFVSFLTVWRSAGNTIEENSSVFSKCTSCHQQGHAGSKTVLQQNRPLFNWSCWITQDVLYNSCKAVVVVVCVFFTRGNYDCVGKERKGKEEYLYSAFSHQGTYKALRHGSHSFTCKQHHACLSFVAFTRCHHHSNWGSRHPIAAHYSFIDPERMKGWVGLVGWPIADGLPT